MQAMKAQMAAEGGSRDTARAIYQQMYQQSDDPNIRETARRRLLQLRSFDERDVIRKIQALYLASTGRCPESWKSVGELLRQSRLRMDSSGTPLDPANYKYQLAKNGCDVDLDPHSEIPHR
jgi:hypothetical protein